MTPAPPPTPPPRRRHRDRPGARRRPAHGHRIPFRHVAVGRLGLTGPAVFARVLPSGEVRDLVVSLRLPRRTTD